MLSVSLESLHIWQNSYKKLKSKLARKILWILEMLRAFEVLENFLTIFIKTKKSTVHRVINYFDDRQNSTD